MNFEKRCYTGNFSGMTFLKNNLRMVQGEQDFNSVGRPEIPEVALAETRESLRECTNNVKRGKPYERIAWG